MRSVKFRVWTGNELLIISHEAELQLNFGINDGWSLWERYRELCTHKDGELMQFTGLLDRNGKEIYEGDILDCTCELLTNFGRTRTGKMGTTIYEVVWRGEGWGKRVLRSGTLVVGKDSDGVAITAKYSEVIGNIYEHPHLLEATT